MPTSPSETPAVSSPAIADGPTAGGGSHGVPLHERLKQYRQSPFGDAPEASAPATESAAAHRDAPASTPTQEARAGKPESLPAPPTDAEPSTPGVAVATPHASEPKPLAAAKPAAEQPQEPSVLIDHKSPQLSVETIGPRKIVVGKEAAFEVVLQNAGEQAAEEVAVTVGLPDWADVAGASASSGEVAAGQADRRLPCRWALHRVEAHSKEKLTLKIVPRQSKPFELAVRWDFKQSPSQALIEVQEPKLTMHLDGPREVLFNKKELYKLKLSNIGNGPAENVAITIMPINPSDGQAVTHRLGTIAAGDERTIEVELTARQAGRVVIRVEATGDNGSRAALAENVVVHRGGLAVELDGPAFQFVGTPANYRLVVRNPGDAPSKNVKLTAKLPTGMRFVSGSDGAKGEDAPEGGKVTWNLERLDPGAERVLQMKCTLAVSGPNRLEITSAADDELVASAEGVTRVEAVADVRLEVKDPDGPVPVGTEAVYELHIRNKGTKTAENVEVVSYFSNGVEPVSAEGHTHRIAPGQVVFDLIPAIPPATELVLTVKAKAQIAGNHVFRAEVHCKSAGTRLVREEMTHFYADGPSSEQELAGSRGESNRSDSYHNDSHHNDSNRGNSYRDDRTAERQAPLPLPQSPDQPMPSQSIKR